MQARVTGQVLTLDATFQEIIPALLALLDALPEDHAFLKLDPSQRRRRTLEGLKRVLLRESQVQPLLLVFEDLHWIDSETQALLDSLAESLPAARLLLLVNYRPEYEHGWGSKTYYTQLRLDPLPPTSAEAFLEALLGFNASLAPLKQLLIAHTGGNPFFLEETARTLVETGVLVGTPGEYRLMQSLPSIQVPATVQAVLAARIDRLPPDVKHLLQVAAVSGMEVPFPLLYAIAGMPEEMLHRGLAQLQAAEFLYETRLFPEREYTFKHALTHEVAYGSLLQEQRRVLHAQIVETIEATSPDRVTEQVERLAHHALRGEAWEKALAYFRQAGERAMARSAHHEAVGYFDQALHALAHVPAQRETQEQGVDLRLALRSALLPALDSERILACLCEAEALAVALDDHRRLGQISGFLSVHFRNKGTYDQAITAAQRALATARGDVVLEALANLFLGAAFWAQGDYQQASDCFRQTVASLSGTRRYQRFGQATIPAVQSRAFLAGCLAELGLFAEAHTLGEEGRQIAEEMAHPSSLMWADHGVGLLALRQGNLPRALPLLERAVSICQEAHLPLFFPRMAAALGTAYTLSGHVADAVALLTQATEQTIAMEMTGFQVLCSLPLGEAQMLAGHLAEACALTEQALALARRCQERGHQAYALHLLGEITVQREPSAGTSTEAYYRQAFALAEELGMRPLMAHCHFSLGTLYSRMGKVEQARAELAAASLCYRSMEMTFWLPRAEAALAQAGSA
jgi:tetratricopeptide (TPR) repeat protein